MSKASHNSIPLLGFHFQRNFFLVPPNSLICLSLLFHSKLSFNFFIYSFSPFFLSFFYLFQFFSNFFRYSSSNFLLFYLLQLKFLVLDRRRTLYRVYTRELNRELCTGLSTLYTSAYWSVRATF